MKKTDPRYPDYLIYQRNYQSNRRRDDEDFRLKRNWAVHKCYWMARDKDTAMMPGKVVEKKGQESLGFDAVPAPGSNP